ncbi:F-box/LRR-repeat protein At5g63520-like [Quercus lobata]|uniref:F-box domain-containing protein n=1 Tax=Quercus lobata TaxID=97700 RepID=A0A7N2L8D8_QUELO|nr:F-box/LRR-repeat protein At5g63520-like [Quercus lobata]
MSCGAGEASNSKSRGRLELIINDDILEMILEKLPALSFASAACVSKSWNKVCNHILSSPKLSSALSYSFNPSTYIDGVQEVLHKVLSKPIRPHFAIASIGYKHKHVEAFKLITKRLGQSTPLIITVASGIIGRDALTNEFREVKWKDIAGDSDEEFGGYIGNRYNRIALTVGYVPGLKVDAVSLRQSVRVTTLALKNESLQVVLDKFVKHIRDYTATVLASSDPAGIIMFGEGPVDLKPFIDVLGTGWLPLVCERFILLPVTWGRAISGKFMI